MGGGGCPRRCAGRQRHVGTCSHESATSRGWGLKQHPTETPASEGSRPGWEARSRGKWRGAVRRRCRGAAAVDAGQREDGGAGQGRGRARTPGRGPLLAYLPPFLQNQKAPLKEKTENRERERDQRPQRYLGLGSSDSFSMSPCWISTCLGSLLFAQQLSWQTCSQCQMAGNFREVIPETTQPNNEVWNVIWFSSFIHTTELWRRKREIMMNLISLSPNMERTQLSVWPHSQSATEL
ncbi:uncharacterized protein LOC130265094 isoform X1 [Oenanthe melanoleuca]|uniref:uncharacterized protein LOC130265094 isoform X1 n=1 Tax=Oenanthe melanoleuca TaxID=2939378 RepID=UPI0024C16ED8|nr:uncharacterized protein LOC130265094 isoform X1 [Oenanthe melanoleuca]